MLEVFADATSAKVLQGTTTAATGFEMVYRQIPCGMGYRSLASTAGAGGGGGAPAPFTCPASGSTCNANDANSCCAAPGSTMLDAACVAGQCP